MLLKIYIFLYFASCFYDTYIHPSIIYITHLFTLALFVSSDLGNLTPPCRQ